MTSRERIKAALDFIEPDRPPVDFGGHRSSGIMAIAYGKLRRYLGLPEKTVKVYDMIQQLAVIDEDVLDLFGADTIELGRGFCLEDKDWKSWTLPDGTDCLIPAYIKLEKENGNWYILNPSGRRGGVQRKGMLYFDQIYWPYLGGIPEDLSGLPAAIDDIMWSVPSPPNLAVTDTETLKLGAKRLRESTDRAVIFLFGGNLLEMGQFLLRIDNFLMHMAAEPEKTHRLLDALVDVHLANLEKLLPLIGPYADVILFGDDLGMQSAPQISPAMYGEFLKPREKKMWRRVKELAPHIKIQLHSCGSIRPLLSGLIDAGLDAVNPVQTSCAGMDPEGLKADFGKRLCLWGGGCDTQSVLPNKSPAEIRKHVQDRLRILSPGGGFVFQQIHNIMADVPPENIAAMFRAVEDFSGRS